MKSQSDDDVLELLDEPEAASESLPTWKILVVDDDAEVHAATRIALRSERVWGKEVTLLHAYSAREAETVLAGASDVAVILLDVVMESHDAGLRFIETVRETLHDARVRIILRTGQPGYAPELDVVRRYDINDYKTKAELTQVRLVTAVTAAVRAYAHLTMLERHRVGLDLIVRASRDLVRRQGVVSFAEGVLVQLSALLDVPCDGIVCAYRRADPRDAEPTADRFTIVGASGVHAAYLSASLASIPVGGVAEAILSCVKLRANVFAPSYTVIYVAADDRERNVQLVEAAIFLGTGHAVDAEHRALVDVFAENIGVAFANVALFEHLKHLAYHDTGTGLLNREGMLQAIEMTRASGGPGASLALALAEVSDFAHLGGAGQFLTSETGGVASAAIAHRLRDYVGAEGVVARVGDELYALMGCSEHLAPERLQELFDRPLTVDVVSSVPLGVDDGRADDTRPTREGETREVALRATVGYAEVGADAAEVSLRRASLALEDAKAGGAHSAAFSPQMECRATERRVLLQRLRADVAGGRLAVWFQPQVALRTGIVVGMEALLRWVGDDGKFVSTPDVFVPLAEQGGLIVDLGRMVLNASCSALATLRAMGLAVSRVAVNVSPHQFRSARFIEDVRDAVIQHELCGADLELEITEGVTIHDPETAASVMATLRADGIRFAIDDFGTGNASLVQLRKLPFDVLKVDRSFIREFDDTRQPLVNTILALARQMDLETIAEGVETAVHIEAVRNLGCMVAQGFHYARPMPLEQLAPWLERFALRRSA